MFLRCRVGIGIGLMSLTVSMTPGCGGNATSTTPTPTANGNSQTSTQLSVMSGTTDGSGTVVLGGSGGIQVTVKDAGGAPVSNATVTSFESATVIAADGYQPAIVFSDNTGSSAVRPTRGTASLLSTLSVTIEKFVCSIATDGCIGDSVAKFISLGTLNSACAVSQFAAFSGFQCTGGSPSLHTGAGVFPKALLLFSDAMATLDKLGLLPCISYIQTPAGVDLRTAYQTLTQRFYPGHETDYVTYTDGQGVTWYSDWLCPSGNPQNQLGSVQDGYWTGDLMFTADDGLYDSATALVWSGSDCGIGNERTFSDSANVASFSGLSTSSPLSPVQRSIHVAAGQLPSGVYHWQVQLNQLDKKSKKVSQQCSLLDARSTACSYSLSGAGSTIDDYPNGGSFPIDVATGAGCPWTANTTTTWLHVPSTSFTGSGSVTLVEDQNTGAARQGTSTIAGRTITFNQAAQPVAAPTPTPTPTPAPSPSPSPSPSPNPSPSPTPSPTPSPSPSPGPSPAPTPTPSPGGTPDFSIQVSPGSQNVTAGNSGNYTGTIQSQNGFNGQVTLGIATAGDSNSGITTRTFSNGYPDVLTPPANGTASTTLTLGSTTSLVGSFSATIQGQSGSLIHTTSAGLLVSAAPQPAPPACSGAAPTIQTTFAAPIGSTSVSLNGTMNANGLQTNAYFEYGATTGYGIATSNTNMGNTMQTLSIGTTITGLIRNTTYHFRLVAANCAGTSFGGDVAFTTLP